MSIVNLVSGGLDSTLISVLLQEKEIKFYPLFIDYGQLASTKEWEICQSVHQKLKMPTPVRMDLSGFGRVILSGLTSTFKDIKNDAFTPGRNLLFLLVGSAYAYQVRASAVAIGLLSERFSLFPDQTIGFIKQAEKAIKFSLGQSIRVVTPLSDFTKRDVISLAQEKGISGTYSCHAGTAKPCGKCVSCLEFS